jgi:hypothetical protein
MQDDELALSKEKFQCLRRHLFGGRKRPARRGKTSNWNRRMSGSWRRLPLATLGSFKLNDRRSRIKQGPKVTSNRVPTPEHPANENEASPGVARPGFRAAHRVPPDLDPFGLQSCVAPDAAVGTTAYSPHPTPPRGAPASPAPRVATAPRPTWSIRPPARLSPTHSFIQPRPLTPVLSRSLRCAPGCGIRASSRSHVPPGA